MSQRSSLFISSPDKQTFTISHLDLHEVHVRYAWLEQSDNLPVHVYYLLIYMYIYNIILLYYYMYMYMYMLSSMTFA